MQSKTTEIAIIMIANNNVFSICIYICERKYKGFTDYKVDFSHLILLFFDINLI